MRFTGLCSAMAYWASCLFWVSLRSIPVVSSSEDVAIYSQLYQGTYQALLIPSSTRKCLFLHTYILPDTDTWSLIHFQYQILLSITCLNTAEKSLHMAYSPVWLLTSVLYRVLLNSVRCRSCLAHASCAAVPVDRPLQRQVCSCVMADTQTGR